MEQEYRRWRTIAETITNPFNIYQPVLEKIGLNQDVAFDIFSIDFESAVTKYTNDTIKMIFDLVYATNRIKYEKLAATATAEYNPLDNYNMTESGTDTRTPDLTHTLTLNTTAAMTDTRETSTTGESSTNTQNKLNQTHTTTETPNYGETTVHSVTTYDNPTLRADNQEVTTQTGTRTVEESYGGDADTTDTTVTGSSTTTNSGGTSTTNTGTNTQKDTGTDKTAHTLSRKGNIGVTTSQQMLESEMSLAAKMNIFKIIEQDIAAKVFLQVWL